MTFKETAEALKKIYSQQIFNYYGFDNPRKKYHALEPSSHNRGDAHPSMALNTKGESWYLKDFAGECKTYSSVDLIMLKEGLNFPDAVRRGAEICDMFIQDEKTKTLPKDIRFVIAGLHRLAERENFSVKEIVSVKHYEYKNSDKKKLFDKYRIDYIDNTGKKCKYITQGVEKNGFLRAKFKSGEYQSYIAMYGDFQKFTARDKIYIVEGEKCVDICHSKGMKNVVTAGSSNDWKYKGAKFAPYFKDTHIVILQDNDLQGQALTKDIISFLDEVASTIKVLIPDSAEKGADIADFFANGGSLTQLLDMENKTPYYKKDEQPKKSIAEKTILNSSGDEEESFDISYFHKFNARGEPTAVIHNRVAENVKKLYSIFVCDVPYLYRDGVYRPDEKGTMIKDIIKQRIFPDLRKSQLINQIYNLIVDSNELQRSFETVNDYPKSWINFRDCMLDADTMQEKPHNPKYLSVNQLPWKWCDIKSSTDGQEIEKFINFAIPDEQDKEMLLEYFGLTFTVDTRQQVSLLLCGLGGSGKSVFIRLNEEAVGAENTSNISLQALSKRFSTSLLVGKLTNVYADLPYDSLEETGTFKSLIGEDRIFSERKGFQGFMFRNYSKQLFSTNLLPIIQGERNNAFFRRILILKMDHIPDEPNPELFEQLKPEITYFILLCVQALHRMYERGHILRSVNSQKAVRQMKADSDTTTSFIDEVCSLKAGIKTERKLLYNAYEEHCREEERQALSRTSFFKAMRAKGFSEIRGKNSRYFIGISLEKSDGEGDGESGFVAATQEELSEIPFLK